MFAVENCYILFSDIKSGGKSARLIANSIGMPIYSFKDERLMVPVTIK